MVQAELESIQGEHLDEIPFALLTPELNLFQTLTEEIFYSRQEMYDGQQQIGLMCLKCALINQHMFVFIFSEIPCTVHLCINACSSLMHV